MIITIASPKGGVGKSTTAIFLSLALADRGIRTLAVDLDPANALTDFFLRSDVAPESIEARSVLKILTGEATVDECVVPIDLTLSVIGSTPNLMIIPDYLARDPAGLMRLRSGLRKSCDIDAVVIDSPPALGPLLTAGLLCADLVLSPVSPHRWILQARAFLDRELVSVTEMTGALPPSRVLFSMVSPRELETLRTLGLDACQTAIPRSESLRRAVDLGKRLNPKSAIREAFSALSKEVYP